MILNTEAAAGVNIDLDPSRAYFGMRECFLWNVSSRIFELHRAQSRPIVNPVYRERTAIRRDQVGGIVDASG